MAREPFLLVTGAAGMGKTKLVRDAVAAWGSRAAVAFVANPALTRTELLEEIVRRFGVTPPAAASKPQLLACLEQRLAEVAERSQVPVIVVDDAHDLDDDLLGELRLLANSTAQADIPLKIVLAGLPDLEARLADPAFASLRQRVAIRGHVGPLTLQETRRYLQEIAPAVSGDAPGLFARKASGEIFRRSGGAPPTVHALALEAMRRARESGAQSVTSEHVHAAAGALGLAAPAPEPEASPRAGEPAPVAPTRKPDAIETREPAVAARSATPSPAPVTESPRVPVVDPRPADVRGREWVERFIKPDEPRFGSLLRTESRRPPDAGTTPIRVGDSGSAVAAAAALPAAAPPRRQRPTARHHRRSLRFPVRLPRSWLVPAAIGVFAITAVFVFIVVPRDPSPSPPGGAQQAPASAPGTGESPSTTKPGKPAARKSSTSGQRVALNVGSYVSDYRAEVERDRLTAETGLEGWVVAGTENGATIYHVVIGIYSTPERAERSADVLLSRGLVTEARVIPLPPRSQRR